MQQSAFNHTTEPPRFLESCNCPSGLLAVIDSATASNRLLDLFQRSTNGTGYINANTEANWASDDCCDNQVMSNTPGSTMVISNSTWISASTSVCNPGATPSNADVRDIVLRYTVSATRYLVLKALQGIPGKNVQGVITHPETVQATASGTNGLSQALGLAYVRAASYGDGDVAVLLGSAEATSLSANGLSFADALKLPSSAAKVHIIPGLTGAIVMPSKSVVLHVQEWLQTKDTWMYADSISDESSWLRVWIDGYKGHTVLSLLFGGVSNSLGSTYIKAI
jgi:hypothetical protein